MRVERRQLVSTSYGQHSTSLPGDWADHLPADGVGQRRAVAADVRYWLACWVTHMLGRSVGSTCAHLGRSSRPAEPVSIPASLSIVAAYSAYFIMQHGC